MKDESNRLIFDEQNGRLSYKGNHAVLNENTARCLSYMMKSKANIVSNADLLEAGWMSRGLVVSDASVRQAIAQVRKAASKVDFKHNLIVNIPRKGYRLVPNIIFFCKDTSLHEKNEPTSINSQRRPRIHSPALAFALSALCLTASALICFSYWWSGKSVTNINYHYYVLDGSAKQFDTSFDLKPAGGYNLVPEKSIVSGRCIPWSGECDYLTYISDLCSTDELCNLHLK